MIGSKNHHASPIRGTTVSEGSRTDAKIPVLQFADHHQEKAFWIKEKQQLQADLAELNEVLKSELGRASGQSKTTQEWFVAKSAIEVEHGRKRKELVRKMTEIEHKLTAIKLKVQQAEDRARNEYLRTQGDKKQRAEETHNNLKTLMEELIAVNREILAELRKDSK